MKNCKRHLMNQEIDFYQTPTDASEEEIERSCEFVKRLKTMDDKRIFDQYVDAMKTYQSGSLSYTDLRNRITYILCNHDGLLEEFHQLLSDLASLGGRNSTKEKNQSAKSDLERTVEFLNKVEALDEGLYKAFLGAFGSLGDIEALVEHLDVILRDHASLKHEFKTFLIDSRLLKPKRDLEAAARPSQEDKQNISEEWRNVTPSYYIRPEAEEGSSSNEVLNDKYVSVGQFDPEKVVKKKRPHWRYARMNNLEDTLFEKDMFLIAITSVIKFGKDVLCNKELTEKLPKRFDEVVRWCYEGKKVPQIFKTDPKLAVQDILPRLESKKQDLENAKEDRWKTISSRQEWKDNNVYK